MLDVGLLLSGMVVWFGVRVADRVTAPRLSERVEAVDRLLAPALCGVLVGRAVAAALDDPSSLRSVRSFLVVRGGVEFWPGAIALLVVVVVAARRRRRSGLFEAAELVPFALVGYALFEATCLLRDGCYGPPSSLGLVPQGLDTRMFPIGLAVAAATLALAITLQRSWWVAPGLRVAIAIAGLGAIRALAATWLPHLGSGMPRTQRESLAAIAAGFLVILPAAVRRWHRRRRGFVGRLT